MQNRRVHFTTVTTDKELQQIIELQKRNLPPALTPEAMASQGFVTVRHDLAVLQRMNSAYPSVLAKDGEQLAGYCLMMPREFVADLPILAPMMEKLVTLSWQGQGLRDNPRWFIMGQVSVAAAYRGQGVFDGLYHHLRAVYKAQFDFVVTEIAARNLRSRRAHERVGFRDLQVYADLESGETWHITAWNF